MCTLIFITDHAVNEQAGSLHITHKLIISNRKWYSNVHHNLFQLKYLVKSHRQWLRNNKHICFY